MSNTNTKKTNEAPTKPRSAHFILQGKGGVGKSYVAAMLVQYLRERGDSIQPIDTDPVNATLFGYAGLNTKRLELMVNGQLVSRVFDDLITDILKSDQDFVIDNGASSFIPLAYYLAENDVIETLSSLGVTCYIHTIVTGGQSALDTIHGFDSLATQLTKDAKLVVWRNEFQGVSAVGGVDFEDTKAYKQHKNLVHGIVTIEQRTGSTFGTDVEMMLNKKMTFDEVKNSEEFGLLPTMRLLKVRDAVFEQLNHVL